MNNKDIEIIKASKLFSNDYYLNRYSDVLESNFSSYEHYLQYGWKEGRDPSPLFSTKGYLRLNPDVEKKNINPLIYHESIGKYENRKIISINEYDKIINNFYENKLIDYKKNNCFLDNYNKNYDFYLSKLIDQDFKPLKVKNSIIDNLKIVFFTCITDNYDSLKLCCYTIDNARYIAFTDTYIEKMSPWEIRPCLYLHKDPTRTARFIKTHPHLFFKNYDIAIWIDSNIVIKKDLSKIINNFFKSKKTVGCISHPFRNSVYEEFIACKNSQKDSSSTMYEFIKKLKFEGYKDDILFETNFMMFNLKIKNIKNFLNLWWDCIDSYSKRDQLSITYALKRSNANYHLIFNKGITTRNSDFLMYTYHDQKTKATAELFSINSDVVNPYFGISYYDHSRNHLNNLFTESIDIVICIFNAYEATKKCIESIIKHRKNSNLNIIIVNDSSTDVRISQLLKIYSKNKFIKIFENKSNLGYTKSANIGLRNSTANFVILLNSDTIVTDRWYEKLYEVAFSMEEIGIVGPMSNCASMQSLPNIESNSNYNTIINQLPQEISIDKLNIECEKWTTFNIYPIWPLVHGFCFGIKRSVLNKIGYFDEKNFSRGYGEENEYCIRAWKNGFVSALATNTFIFHEKSKSFQDDKERFELMTSGSERFKSLITRTRFNSIIDVMKNHKIVHALREKTKKLFLVCDAKLDTKRIFMIPSLTFRDENEEYPTGSAYIRTIIPFENLEKTSCNISIFKSLKSPHTLPTRDEFDAIIIQREGIGIDIDNFFAWKDYWKNNNGKIIYDIDDNLELIDSSLKQRIDSFIKEADTVIVSTKELRNNFINLNKNIYIVENKIDEILWKFSLSFEELQLLKMKRNDDLIHIGFIGTPSHYGDIYNLENQINTLKKEFNSKISFDVIGVFQSQCPNFVNKIPLPKKSDYLNFVNWLLKVAIFDIAILPLSYSPFNKFKSNLKFIEYSALGLPIVCTDHYIYSGIARNFENCLVEKNESIINGIRRLIHDNELRIRIAKNARKEVIEKHGIQNNIEIYKNIVYSLYNK